MRHRVSKNVHGQGVRVSKSAFWRSLVMALVTTQQRSGPGTPVFRFLSQKPFPLHYKSCVHSRDLEQLGHRRLSDFRLRRSSRIAKEVAKNLRCLERGLWRDVLCHLRGLLHHRGRSRERKAARFLAANLTGIGPKQSRNLLQNMGLVRYEIPLDSRIVKWLNEFEYPVVLSAAGLADQNYYEFVLDGVQALCARARILPSVLDAVIFASYDGDKWETVKLD